MQNKLTKIKTFKTLLLFFVILNQIYCINDIILAELNILPTSSSVVGEESVYELKIYTPRDIGVGSIISLDFSDSEIVTHQSTLETCTLLIDDTGSSHTYSNCTCISNVCQVTITEFIYEEYLIIINMGKLTNPPSVKTQNSIYLEIQYSNFVEPSELTLEMTQEVLTPGQIRNSSVTQESYKVGETNKYTFAFNPTNQIPSNGKIKVILPQEVNLPQNNNVDIQPTAQINIYNNGLVSASIENPVVSKEIFIYGFTTPVAIQEGESIIVEISGLQNPISITTSQSFKIQTVTQNNFIIDIIENGITVQSTDPGDITGIDAYITGPDTNSQINKEATFTIKALPAQPFFSGGKFEVIFPDQFSINPSNFSCSKKTGLTITDGTNTSKCAFTDNTVYTTNMQFASTNNNFIWITFDGIILPSNTKETDAFIIKTYDSSSNVICINSENVTFTAFPGTINVSKSERSVIEVNNNTQINFDFTLTNSILKNSYLNFLISKDQIITNGNTVQCHKIIGGSLEVSQPCSIISTESDHYVLQTQEWCSDSLNYCPDNQFLQFQITEGFKNTEYIIVNNILPIEMITYTPENDGTKYDEVDLIQLTPSLEPYPLENISFQRSGSNDVGGISTYTIQYTQSDYIQQNSGNIEIFFPLHTVNKPYAQNIICKVNSETKSCNVNLYSSDNLTESSIQSIKILDVCSSTACQTQPSDFVIELENTRNPLSNYPLPYTIGEQQPIENGQYFGIKTYTLTDLVIGFGQAQTLTGYINNEIINQSTINVSKSDDTIGIKTQYTFEIPLQIEFLKSDFQSQMEVQFPSQIIIDQTNSICSARISFSNIINCEIQSESLIKITHSMTGEFIFNNPILTIIITQIRNPQTSQISDDFTFTTYNIQNTYISQKWTFGIQSTLKKQLSNISASRDITEINQNTEVIIQFTHYNPLPQDSQIQIKIPDDQLQFENSITSSLTVKNQSADQQVPFIVDTDVSDGQGYILFTLIENAQCPCSGNTHQLTYVLTGGKNPSVARPPMNSISVTTMDKNGYFMEVKTTDFFILPVPSAGQLIINNFNSSNRVTGFDQVDLTINVTLNNDVPQNGKFLIFLPEDMYFESSDSLVVKQDDNIKNTVSVVKKSGNLDDYIFSISIQICESGICPKNSNTEIKLENLRNKPSVSEIATDIIISTSDIDSYLIDQNQFSTQNLIPNIPADISNISLTRNQNIVSQDTQMIFIYTTENILPQNSQIILNLPISEIIVQSNTQCLDNALQPQTCDIDTTNNKITIQNLCNSSYCPESTNFEFQIQNLKNQQYIPVAYTPPFTDIQIQAQNNDLIQQNDNSFTITPILSLWDIENIDFEIKDNLQVGNIIDFQLTFDSKGEVDQNSIIKLEFLNDLSLRKSKESLEIEFYIDNNLIPQNLITSTFNYQQNQDYSYITSIIIEGINQDNSNQIQNNSQIKIVIKSCMNELYEKQFNSDIKITFYKDINQQQKHSETQFSVASIHNYYFQAIELDSDFLQIVRLDSEYLSENTDINFNYILPSPLLQNSEIRFKLPKQQIILPNNVSCTNNITCNVISTDIDYFYLQIMQDFCVNTCDTNYVLNFSIEGCQNPSSKKMSQQNQVEIETNFSNKSIHQTQEISLSPKLKINNDYLLITKLTRTSSVIDTDNSLNFEIVLNNDNDIIDLTSQTLFFVIQLPDMLAYESLQNLEFYVDGIDYTSNIINQEKQNDIFNDKYYKKLVITQICNQIDCTKEQNKFNIEIKNIKNPQLINLNNNTENNVVFAITDSSYYGLLEDSYPATSILPELNMSTSLINLQSFTRNSQILDQDNIQIDLQFEILKPILPNTYIDIYIPIVQALQSSNQVICNMNSSLVSCEIQQITENIKIRIQENCSINDSTDCPANTIFNIQLQNLKNPTYQSHKTDDNSAKIELVYEYNLYKVYKQAYIYENMFLTPDLTALDISTFSVTRNLQDASQITDLNIYFEIPTGTPTDSEIIINFPHNFGIYNDNICINDQSNVQLECQFTYNSAQSPQYIEFVSLQCDQTSGNICQQNQTVLIKLTQKNQIHTKDLRKSDNNFSLHLRKNSIDIAHGYYSTINLQQIQPGQINIDNFTSSNYEIGNDNVEFNFNLNLSSYLLNQDLQGSLQLSIPQILMQENGEEVKCTVTNPVQQYQYICYVISEQSQILIIKENNSLQQQIPETLQIQVTGLNNPKDSRTLTGFQVVTQGQVDDELVIFDQNLDLTTYTATILGNLNAVVTRSNNQIYQETPVRFEISQNSNPLLNSDYKIAIDITQSYQFIFSNNQNLSCQDAKNGNSSLSCYKNSENLIIIEDICDSGCPENSNFNIIINQGLQNVPYYKTSYEQTESLGIYTVVKENNQYYKIDGVNENQVALPLIQKNQFTNFNAQQNTNVAMDSILYQFNFNSISTLAKQLLENSYTLRFNFQIPQNSVIFNQFTGDYLQCQIDNQQQNTNNCKYINDDNNVQILLNEDHKSQNFSEITIEGLRNYYYEYDNTQIYDFSLQIQDQNQNYQNVYIQEFAKQDFFNDIVPQQFQDINIFSDSPFLNKITQFQYQFKLYHDLPLNENLQIIINDINNDSNNNHVYYILNDNQQQTLDNISIQQINNGIFTCNTNGNVQLKKGYHNLVVGNIKLLIADTIYFSVQIKYENNIIVKTNNSIQIKIQSQEGNDDDCSDIDSNCAKCDLQQNICLQCKVPSEKPFYDTNTQQCISKCENDQYWDQPNLQCQECHESCLECQGGLAEDCTECQPDHIYIDGLCVQIPNCPEGTFLNDQNQCQTIDETQCDLDCLLCGVQIDYCLNCSIDKVLDQELGQCLDKCNNGKYYDQNTLQCEDCDETCETCQENFENCLSCSDIYDTIDDIILFEGQCLNNCPSGYYKSENQCQECSENCIECESQQNCVKCQENYYYDVQNQICVEKCDAQTQFQDEQNKKCLQICENEDEILSQEGDCVKNCPIGQEQKNNDSQQCDYIVCDIKSCALCADNKSCYLCTDDKVKMDNGDCTDSCPENGYFYEKSAKLCTQCKVQNCQNCSENLDRCIQCETGFYYDQEQNICGNFILEEKQYGAISIIMTTLGFFGILYASISVILKRTKQNILEILNSFYSILGILSVSTSLLLGFALFEVGNNTQFNISVSLFVIQISIALNFNQGNFYILLKNMKSLSEEIDKPQIQKRLKIMSFLSYFGGITAFNFKNSSLLGFQNKNLQKGKILNEQLNQQNILAFLITLVQLGINFSAMGTDQLIQGEVLSAVVINTLYILGNIATFVILQILIRKRKNKKNIQKSQENNQDQKIVSKDDIKDQKSDENQNDEIDLESDNQSEDNNNNQNKNQQQIRVQ